MCAHGSDDRYEACNFTTTREIKQLDHSYKGAYKWDESKKTHSQLCINGCNEYGPESACDFETVVTQPNCMTDGVTTHICKVCGNSYETDRIQAQGHSWGEWKHVDGTEKHQRICANNAEHVEQADCTIKRSYRAPTCVAEGYAKEACTDCGNVYSELTIEKTEHRYVDEAGNENLVVIPESCTSGGEKYKV